MAAADYRLMTEATGQRIAAALEALSGTGAAAAAARANLDVYSTGETDELIARSTANTNLNGTVTGYLPVKNTGCAIFSSGNASSAYNVMSQLVAGRCAPFIITNADAASLLTGGKLTSLIKGTLSRTGANGQFYDFIGGPGGGYNKMYSWRVTATSDADMSTQTVYEFTGTAI